ncbi:SusC/RagA family TonB-linked outer membrane protein [Ornithobacterium rhinotracheale]
MRRNLTRLFAIGAFCLSFYAYGQQKPITGRVLDSNGFPIQDAYVYVEGSDKGVYTDENGNYTIEAKDGDVLGVEFIGFDTKNIKVGDGASYDVKLEKGGEINLKSLVAVGYGNQTEKDVTGAITSVKPEELENKSVASITQVLQGKSPGLQIVNSSGRAGDQTQISIRGNGSLMASNNVLYVIDGVPQESMGSLSNEDIKSISVLKDAASAAIYGSRASNGVILIETKKGGYGEKTTVRLNVSRGFSKPVKVYDLLNAAQYKQIHDVSRENYMRDIADGKMNGPKDAGILTPMGDSPYDTDWLKYIVRDVASLENYSLSIGGGGMTTRSYFSASYFKQEGLIKEDNYEKSRLRLNVEQKITDFLSMGVNSYFSYTMAKTYADGNSTYNPWTMAIKAPPTAPAYKDGKIYKGAFKNPLWAFERDEVSHWQKLGGQFYFDVEPLKDLKWRSTYSGSIDNGRINRYDAPSTRRGQNGDGKPTGYGYYKTNNNRNYQFENTLTWNKSFFNKNLKMNLLAGHTYQHWDYEDAYVQGEKFSSDDLKWLVSAGEINKGRSYILSIGLESVFTRMQLNWKDKYLFMASVRRDGSTKFSDGNKWGTFPAASLGWVVSEEDFLKGNASINLLKLRASYGLTGNQSGISYAVGQKLLTGGENYDQEPGLASVDIYNPDLKWETGYSSNIGLDLKLWKRFNLSVDVYSKITKDLLNRVSVEWETGFKTMLKNAGEINNKGFEVNASVDIIKKQDLKWNLATNFSYNENKIKNLGMDRNYYTTGFVSIVKEGESLGAFYLLENLGIAQQEYTYRDAQGNVTHTVQPGDVIYKDQNGDGVINDDDRIVYTGGIAPVYGGVSTSLSYKGFDLSISGQYSINKKIYAMYREDLLNGGAIGYPAFSDNMVTDALDYWSVNNTNASQPRPHMAAQISSWNNQRSSRFLDKADYFRISDITLGFDLKSIKSLNLGLVEGLKVYVQARNPFTFTSYKGLDPEGQYVDQGVSNNQNQSDGAKIRSGVDNGVVPNMKSINIGLNVKF